ncbi:MAG TPA: phosphodiesterase [Chromatiales bacterium]|nr:phosphodiesterase [Chromatiales bacterium]
MRLIAPLLTLALCVTGVAAHAASGAPEKGQSMNSVLKHYGEPAQRIAAVGEPPISRWVYPEFTVYFEHNHTIHSVQHQKRVTPTAAR